MKLPFFFLFWFFVSSWFVSFSQNSNISARLTIYSGGNADIFYFNSMSKYKSGIQRDRYTKLAISWVDGAPDTDPPSAPHNWELRVLALSATIDGESVGNSLPHETVRLLAQQGVGGDPVAAFCQLEDHMQVPPAELVLVTGAPFGDFRVDITYKVGTYLIAGPDYNQVLGTNDNPDHYTIDLQFTLTEVGF